jgi:hypothetical protein
MHSSWSWFRGFARANGLGPAEERAAVLGRKRKRPVSARGHGPQQTEGPNLRPEPGRRAGGGSSDRGVRHAARKRGVELLDRGSRTARRRRRRAGRGGPRASARLDEGREPAGVARGATTGARGVSSATTGGGDAEVLEERGGDSVRGQISERSGRHCATRSSGLSRHHPRNRVKREKYRENRVVRFVRTSTLFAEEPATRRAWRCVVTHAGVGVLSAGTVEKETRVIGVMRSD